MGARSCSRSCGAESLSGRGLLRQVLLLQIGRSPVLLIGVWLMWVGLLRVRLVRVGLLRGVLRLLIWRLRILWLGVAVLRRGLSVWARVRAAVSAVGRSRIAWLRRKMRWREGKSKKCNGRGRSKKVTAAEATRGKPV